LKGKKKMTKTVSAGDTVTLHYKGTFTDGTQFDSSYEREEPMIVTIGRGQLISGFDNAVHGMTEGETKTFTLAPQDAYGDRQDDRTTILTREVFPEDVELNEGNQIPLRGPDGSSFLATVTATDDTTVTFDLNHPMAGKELTFEVNVVNID
jgi:peptidylprolyl isomerase